MDISSLKNRAYLEGLRDLNFIDNFEGIRESYEEIENIFYPFDTRTVLKIVERKVEVVAMKVLQSNSVLKEHKIVSLSMKKVFETFEKILKVDDLKGIQKQQLLFYIRKELLDKYGLMI